MKFAVAGLGYVGLSLSILLSRHYKVNAYDICHDKINLLNQKKSPIKDDKIEKFLLKKNPNFTPIADIKKAFGNVDYIIICTPTNFDPKTKNFDVSSVENLILAAIKINKTSNIIIKSTIPIGFTEKMREKYNKKNIYFSPEFLREGKALEDNLYPSRIIVGSREKPAKKFGNSLLKCSSKIERTFL